MLCMDIHVSLIEVANGVLQLGSFACDVNIMRFFLTLETSTLA